VARRELEGFTQRKLPDRSAWLTSTIAHWAYGSAAGAAYGILAGSPPAPHPECGVPFGVAVFAGDYIALSAPDRSAAAGRDGAGAAQGGERGLAAAPAGWEKLSMAWAALTGPTPYRLVRPGAMSIDDDQQMGAVASELAPGPGIYERIKRYLVDSFRVPVRID
jgi:hypothetical protein